VRLGPHLSSTLTLSTGSPQGCVLSPLLYALYTYDCTPTYPTNHIIKYADDTTVVGCVHGGEETAYRAEVKDLPCWCSDNNLTLNILKTKELILDFRKHRQDYTPLLINWERLEIVTTFRFLGTYLSAEHSWTYNIRYAGSTAEDRKAVQRVINTAQKIIGCPLPSLENISISCCLRGTKAIVRDPSHPAYPLFDLLPSGRHYRSVKSHTNRLTYSFFPWAIWTANTHGHSHT